MGGSLSVPPQGLISDDMNSVHGNAVQIQTITISNSSFIAKIRFVVLVERRSHYKGHFKE